ncbi:CDP-alcohol phosphatidyltransferase family protein [Arthrobacter sp. PAMC25284]|uniref:CDP-alcohol phosphatidyltransferase family protein n=1 Tax=Arthrobacter sp. PAMC25284 TaxID=2861279 RepID=UPI001C634868|nr:CDP-alcohol phosphatidyltransferase family protein [Arthrobacter sp. PAMC25284]QYF90900.1 CDP-alcohol phosphatidyltransferase family protein [Arthrobacter sp. PAMC25284]
MTAVGSGSARVWGTTGYWATVKELSAAQKTAARGAPAYSRYINRRLGRLLAAAALRAGLGPNAVTAISAVFTFAGIALLVVFPPSAAVGVSVALCLVVGYAFDSADGQVARMQGSGSPAGEWLDHMVDAVKTSLMPLALAVGLYRFDAVAHTWLLVPLGAAVVSAALFFCMILTEQLRRHTGRVSVADPGGRSWLRSLLVVPMDYGVLCLSFIFYGALPVFLTVYTLIFAATAAFLVLASIKWFRELSAMAPLSRHDHQTLQQGVPAPPRHRRHGTAAEAAGAVGTGAMP